MLIKIAKRRHSHLIQLLTTYTLGGEYHFLFPWADANLRKLWKNKGLPPFNEQKYLWTLQQMRGLASALQVIHEYEFPEAYAPLVEGQLTVGRFRISGVKQTDPKYGRHGDLKPENILFFEATGNLQITDLGLGQFHGVKSRSKIAAEGIGGSPTYIPPEILLKEPVSRAYDIWSLGCVFLEFITWLVEGGEAVYSFADNRIEQAHDKVDDDTFFIIAQGKAFVRKGVTSWIERLKGNPSGRCSPMIKELLQLVLEEMLVIDYEKRIKVEPLYFKLKAIHERGKEEPQYLLG
jgi:serine/threonine protein kinase